MTDAISPEPSVLSMHDRLRNIVAGARLLLAGAVIVLFAPHQAIAGFTDSESDLTFAISALRSNLGAHPRVLKIEIERDVVTIEVQDPGNASHIDQWRYGAFLQFLPLKRLSGPSPVDPTLINPDLEANLFDLDDVDFSAFGRLSAAAIARAKLQDAAAITRIEIARQIYILPKPSSGDVRWTLHVDSGRERADIYANARGEIIGSDLSGTQRARTLNLLAEPELLTDAAGAARTVFGTGTVLTKVGIDAKSVSFATNIPDHSLSKIFVSLPTTASYTWDLDGLRQRLGNIAIDVQMGAAPAAPFAVDDVNWTLFGKLELDALAKVAIPHASVTHLGVEKSTDLPGGAALVLTVEVTAPGGEITTVVADTKGQIVRVVLPESRRPKVDWLAPVTLANAIKRVGPIFGANVKIASIVMEDRGGRITVDDPANSGKASTFDFTSDSVNRSPISFSFDSAGPRFSLADLAGFDEIKIATLETLARQKITVGKPAWLESVTIGPHPFVRSAGAHAIEIRFRDIEVDSVKAEYCWIVFDFNGRVLDFVTF
jgi:hypothetical protein